MKLILFDIEGTLTGINGRGHSAQLLPSLERLMKKGIIVGILTGREVSYAKAINRLFDLNGPIIAENGCALFPDFKNDETQCINYGGLSEKQKESIRQKLIQEGILDIMYEDKAKNFMFTLYLNEFPNHSIKKLIKEYYKVKKNFEDKPKLEITHSSAAVDINPKGINKGSAIVKYCKEQDIPLSSVVFVGDSLNDLSAFEAIGKGGGQLAVVSDSIELREKLKDFSVYYSKKTASEGVVEFISYLLK